MKTEKEIQKQIDLLEKYIFGDDCKGKMDTSIIIAINQKYSDDADTSDAIRTRNILKWILGDSPKNKKEKKYGN